MSIYNNKYNHKFLVKYFIIGIILSIKLYTFGEVYIGELVAILFLIVKKIHITKAEKQIIVYAIFWSSAQLISDLINNTKIIDAMKGVGAPVVFASSIIFIIKYTRGKFLRLPSLLLGFSIGMIINLLIFPTEYFIFNSWKWGMGNAVLQAFLIYYSFFLRNKKNIYLFVFLGFFFIISLHNNARSMAIFPLIMALVYMKYNGRKTVKQKEVSLNSIINFKNIISSVILIFLANTGLSAIFSSESILSNFNKDSASTYKNQADGAYGILLGGRSEILISSIAFLDKPLFGHGSWAVDKNGYSDRYRILLSTLGYTTQEDEVRESKSTIQLIPTHSFLMGAFVWAGIFGGLFWLVLMRATIESFFKYIYYLPVYFYVGMIGFIWSVFFSPFGADARWTTAVFIASFFSQINYVKIKNQFI